MSSSATDASAPTATPADGKRRTRLIILAAVVIVIGVGYGLYWWLHARFYESTDDAYVSSDVVQITSEVAGAVRAVYVDDTQHVERGQVLVEIDKSDAEVAMAQAEAELARTVRQVRGVFSQTAGLDAQIRERELSLAAAKADLKRRQQAGDDGAVSGEELQHARDVVAQLQSAVTATRESLQTTRAQVENTTLENNPQVLAAATKVREAALALKRTRIVAPVAGTIARRSVQIGARIAPGTPLMAVVALSNAWVDANFKEVQLKNIRIGQPAELRADVYGDDVVYHGKVAGLGAGSGSAFALLPAQNASGNWIKIVQRVPVRIALNAQELNDHPLQVGLSMHARLELKDTSGTVTATQLREAPQQIVAGEDYNEDAQREIARIIASNSGRAASTAAP
jgi:membrane fusion protein (multidrug efflux system)